MEFLAILVIVLVGWGSVDYLEGRTIWPRRFWRWFKGENNLWVMRDGKPVKWNMSIGINDWEVRIRIRRFLWWRWAKIINKKWFPLHENQWQIYKVEETNDASPTLYLKIRDGQTLETMFKVVGSSLSLSKLIQLKEWAEQREATACETIKRLEARVAELEGKLDGALAGRQHFQAICSVILTTLKEGQKNKSKFSEALRRFAEEFYKNAPLNSAKPENFKVVCDRYQGSMNRQLERVYPKALSN